MTIGIIGGGIVGSVAAYYLARAGQPVTLYDHGEGQATRAAAGIICPWFSLRRNQTWYQLVREGAACYPQLMADLQADGYRTDAIYRPSGALLVRRSEKRLQQDLDRAHDKQAEAPQIGQVRPLRAEEVATYYPELDCTYPALWVEGGACVDGAALIATLHQAIQAQGGRIVGEHVHLTQDNGDTPTVQTSEGPVNHDALLLSVGAWLAPLLEPLGYAVDVHPQKGQLIVLDDPESGGDRPVVMLPGQCDLIPSGQGQLRVGATHEDDQGYDLTPDADTVEDLFREANEWLPHLAQATTAAIQVGTRAQTSDYGVLVGEVPGMTHTWAVSGLGSSGLTSGTYLGTQWAQRILTGEWAIQPEDYPIETYIQQATPSSEDTSSPNPK